MTENRKGINFSEPNTRNIAIKLYERFMKNDYSYQTLTLFTGFGKTAISVATAGIFAVKYKQDINVFIIAPKTKLEDNSWEWTVEEYNKIAKYKLNILDQTTPQGLLVAKKNDKLRKKDIKAMRPTRQKELKFLKNWKEQIKEKPTVVLVDEVQDMKNPTAKTSKALMDLLSSSSDVRGIGLSATPMPNGILDDGIAYLVYNNFYKNQSDFRNQHIPPNMYDKYFRPNVYTKDHEIDPNRFYELDLFLSRIRETTFVPDVVVDFDIPNQRLHTLPYDLAKNTIDDIYTMSKHYKERRYDSHMAYLADIRRAISSDKHHAEKLVSVIKEYPNTQPLIFYETNQQLETIENSLKQINMPYRKINGQSDSDKVDEIDETDTNQAIVIQYKSGGKAIEFKNSFLTIFYGLVYSWGDIKQAMGRNIRRGMPKDSYVNQVFLVATHSHDAKVYKTIERKEEFSDRLLLELAEDISNEVLE